MFGQGVQDVHLLPLAAMPALDARIEAARRHHQQMRAAALGHVMGLDSVERRKRHGNSSPLQKNAAATVRMLQNQGCKGLILQHSSIICLNKMTNVLLLLALPQNFRDFYY